LVLEAEEVSFPAQTFIEALPPFLQKIDNFTLTWQYRKKGEENWKELIAITHKIYLTLKEVEEGSMDDEIILKFIYENLPQGIEITNKEQFLEEIWRVFKMQNGNPVFKQPTYDQQPLRYYADPQNNNPYPKGLCRSKDGQCTAWAMLLAAVLRSQGFEASRVEIISTRLNEKLIVKNWEFLESVQTVDLEDVTYTHVNIATEDYGDFICNDDGTYDFVGSPQVIEKDGLPGQGNPNPISNFDNHYLVKIEGKNGYYDPSYGTTYESLMDFQKRSIAGFYRFSREDVGLNSDNEELYKYYFRESSKTTLELKENIDEE